MKNISTLHIIDSLAEITRHYDPEIIEESLLKTLNELAVGQEFHLYKVISTKPVITVGLLAFSVNGVIKTTGTHAKQHVISEHLKNGIKAAVLSGGLEQVSDPSGKVTHLIYPALDHNNGAFAILIQECRESPDFDILRTAHGLLKVYSNYLELIEHYQRDKLTQLLNRETLDKEITRLLIKNNETNCRRLLRREKDPMGFWLGVIDIDFFKTVNDRYGHLFGDEVLILVARQMEKVIRGDEDLIYRYGGEEFVILLQACGLNAAKAAFDRLRHNIEGHELPQVGHVTVSIGVVQITSQEGSDNVIGCADQALYYAKEHGRNQVCIYESLIEQGLIEKTTNGREKGGVEFF
ncbi:GGDEF domain-containing protein [Methylomonas sp. LL1]|uniref:GGDEF domain-containing protein n=1 Tax=Methylomonas sp. LL1 TaxID=2785785 RepID=UPI0018C39DD0|nr:GGDEF domain-containing protein [Methylomonas sp. LL1]QPK63196.1 GGDEF domain-containing protein [Methylomonas sp. LL1]